MKSEKIPVDELKKMYPVGTVIEMVHMDDIRPVEKGDRGTVRFIDDVGTLHMEWKSGRTLGIVPEEDIFEVVSKPLTEEE